MYFQHGKKKLKFGSLKKINKKINSKEKKKYPLHELKRRRLWWEAKGRRLGVGGKGSPEASPDGAN